MASIPRAILFLGQYHRQQSFNVVLNTPTTNYFQPQPLIVPKFPHPVVTFTIPVILNLIEIKCQCNGSNSPFETNPKTVWFAVSCLLAYCLAYGIELRSSSTLHSPNHSDNRTLIRRSSSLFGSLCLASFMSILLPPNPVLYGFYGLLSVADILLSYDYVKLVWKWIDQRVVCYFFRPSEGQQVEQGRLPV